MANEQSLRDLLEERQIGSETVYQAVRYYLAERLKDPDPDDLLAQLATVVDYPDDTLTTLSSNALLLEDRRRTCPTGLAGLVPGTGRRLAMRRIGTGAADG